jgi:hypothetical protein
MGWPFDILNRAAKFPVGSPEWDLLQALCQGAAKASAGGGGS